MSSNVMDPQDLEAFAAQSNSSALYKNFTIICMRLGTENSRGIFSSDPLSYAIPLLLLQMSLASAAVFCVSLLLKLLGQPLVVRQLLGGLILGPSFLGRNRELSNRIFPLRGFIMLDAISSFAFLFYTFLVGLQIDPRILKGIERKAYVMGFFTVAVPMVLSTASYFPIIHNNYVDQNIANSLPVISQVESVLAFPVVAQFLTELKVINSEFARLALSSSMVGGLCSFVVITTTVLWQECSSGSFMAFRTFFNSLVLGVVIIFVIRPAALWIIKRNPEGEPLKESYVISLMVAVLMTAFFSQALGLHLYFGPLFLGIVLPAGGPIGSSLGAKLDLIVSAIFMPIYLAKNGLVINVFAIKFKNFFMVQFIALVCAFGKFLGAFLVSLFCRLPVKQAASLGLVMNAKAVLDIGMLKMMERNKAIDSEAYISMYVSIVLVAAIITPIIKHLYDPSNRYMVYGKRTIINAKPNSELRVLVCIRDQENVPASINLLKALNPTERWPLCVFVLNLIELVGQQNPLLITHKLSNGSSERAKAADPVVNAFRYFEQSMDSSVTVYPFTTISPSKTMHDDVCTIALDNATSLIIVPYHKKFQASGRADSMTGAVKMTNNVLDKAPCSIAILVDRGLINSSTSILDSWSYYHVAVLFLGGPDDREAVAIAARMAGRHNIYITLIRLLKNGSISCDSTREMRLDNAMVSAFRAAMAENYRVTYVEEVVMDGAGTISVIRSMKENYELVIVGRNHDNKSPLLSGLTDWNDHKELGTIGDVLASSQFMGKTTVLVVQQHSNIVNEAHMNRRRRFGFGNQVKETAEDMPFNRKYTEV